MKIISVPLIRQSAAVIIVNLSVMSTGMSLLWTSPVLVKLKSSTETPLSHPITDEEGSWIVSLGLLCGVLFDIVGGILMDSIGRKNCLILASIPKILMGVICIYATEVWMLILARTISLGIDCFTLVITSVYASEIAAKEYRGVLGTFLQIFSCLGSVITLFIGPYTSYRTFNIIFTGIITIMSLPLIFLPESPYHLYSKGKTSDALKVLNNIRSSKTVAEEEIDEYKSSNAKKVKTDIVALWKDKTFLKSLTLGIVLSIGAQLIGYNVVSFYLQSILVLTNTKMKPEIGSVIAGLIQFFSATCSPVITNRFRRKTLLNWSLGGLFCGMTGLGAFFKIRESETGDVVGFMNYLPIISLILVIFSYSCGYGSLYWLIIAEIFNGPKRAFGVAISSVTSHLSFFLIAKYFSSVTTTVGPVITFWFFAAMCALLAISLFIFLPETKGKSFNEIEMALN